MRHKRKANHGHKAADDSVLSTPATTNETDDHATNKFKKVNNWAKSWGRGDVIQALILIIIAIYCGLTALLWLTTRTGIYSGQRAYLLITTVGPEHPPKAGDPMTVVMELKNTGLTPALNVQTIARVDFTKPPISVHSAAVQPPAVDLGAGQVVRLKIPTPIWDEVTLSSVISQKSQLVIAFKTTYNDIFGGSRLNQTEACIVYKPTTNSFESCGTSLK